MPAQLSAVAGRELHLDRAAARQLLPPVDRAERVRTESARDLRRHATVHVAGAVGELLLPLLGVELGADSEVADAERRVVELVADAQGRAVLVELVAGDPRRVGGDAALDLRVDALSL